MEWRVRFDNGRWGTRTEWTTSEDYALKLSAKPGFLDMVFMEHVLDY